MGDALLDALAAFGALRRGQRLGGLLARSGRIGRIGRGSTIARHPPPASGHDHRHDGRAHRDHDTFLHPRIPMQTLAPRRIARARSHFPLDTIMRPR